MMQPQVVICPQKKKIIPYKITHVEAEASYHKNHSKIGSVQSESEPFIDFKVVASFKKDSEELIRATVERGKKFERYKTTKILKSELF